jgi:hypothetical protein
MAGQSSPFDWLLTGVQIDAYRHSIPRLAQGLVSCTGAAKTTRCRASIDGQAIEKVDSGH